jgi:hypothetical protein
VQRLSLASREESAYTEAMNRTNVLDRFLDPVGSYLTPEVARRLIGFRADARTQKRLDRLAEKNQEGELSEAEREEYDTYISAIDFITVLQAKARSILKSHVKS